MVSSAGASRCTALDALVEFPHSQRIKTLFSANCNIFSSGFLFQKEQENLPVVALHSLRANDQVLDFLK